LKQQSNHYDLAIIGNGIIATLAAYYLLKNNNKLKIILVGSRERLNSASMAAGAMHAVYAELEGGFFSNPHEQQQFNNSLAAREHWLELINQLNQSSIVQAKDTVIYANKNGSKFERDNFNTVIQVAEKDGCLASLAPDEKKDIFRGAAPLSEFEAYRIVNEFSINPMRLFDTLDAQLKKYDNFEQLDDKTVAIQLTPSGDLHVQNEKKLFTATRVIVANGSNASKLIKTVDIVPVIQGVGTALLLEHTGSSTQQKYVVRTVNRGGAQCGLHVVPYNGKLYVGAGNYVTDNPDATHRIETIRYLTNTVEHELLGRQAIYNSQVQFLLGYRPRSIDGSPLLGSLKNLKNVFVASGFNRVGLSQAPLICNAIIQWFLGKPTPDYFLGLEPDRELKSWGSLDSAITYYSESRISNLIEHNLINSNDQIAMRDKSIELADFARNANKQINEKKKFRSDFVNDPDIYGYYLSKI
jgi:glycine/D-amino acid oxidase-like deaminating enzyme